MIAGPGLQDELVGHNRNVGLVEARTYSRDDIFRASCARLASVLRHKHLHIPAAAASANFP